MAPDFDHLLGAATRVRGVLGAVVVDCDDGLVVAESIMEGVRAHAIAALAASLFGRLNLASGAAGKGTPRFVQMQSEKGVLVAMPDGNGLLLVVLGEVDMNVGMIKVEMSKAVRGG